jgi:zinc and cadmium transporter
MGAIVRASARATSTHGANRSKRQRYRDPHLRQPAKTRSAFDLAAHNVDRWSCSVRPIRCGSRSPAAWARVSRFDRKPSRAKASRAIGEGEGQADSMTLAYIVLATLAGGVLSVLIAAGLTVAMLSRLVRHLVSLSAGLLLGVALLHVLPEAFESGARPHELFLALLGGLMFFFLLEKAELYRHGHHHEGDGHHHHHEFDQQQAGRGGWAVLVGDAIHNFCDGIIIAGAFLADAQLGLVTALAVIAHEIPQEVGDYIVLLNAGFSRSRALLFNGLSGLAAVAGGVLGYFVVGPWESLFPYVLVIASSSFVYVAVADLLPQLQRPLPLRATLAQLVWLAAGLGFVFFALEPLRGH